MNRLQAHRASRHQAVFRSMPVPVWLDEPEQHSSSALRGRLGRSEPLRRLAATVTRPVGDAVITVQILRLR